MKITRKTNILVATRRKLFIRQSAIDEQIICEQCGGEMMTAQTVPALTGIGIREIYRLVEQAEVHFVEPCFDQIHICLNSINLILQKNIK